METSPSMGPFTSGAISLRSSASPVIIITRGMNILLARDITLMLRRLSLDFGTSVLAAYVATTMLSYSRLASI